MDIQLHGSTLDGIQLTKLLRGTLDRDTAPSYARNVPVLKTPVLFVTAVGTRYSEEELMQAGGNVVIPKPVDFMRLKLALANAHIRDAIRALKKE